MPLKHICLIIKSIHFSNLLDPAYFATKRPFYLRSSKYIVQKCLNTRHSTRSSLLDFSLVF